MTEVYIQRQKRGFFGWVTLLIFLGWNALMIYWLVQYGTLASDLTAKADSDAAQAGAAIGTGLGVMAILFVWGIGSVIFGILALLCRGRKTIVTRQR